VEDWLAVISTVSEVWRNSHYRSADTPVRRELADAVEADEIVRAPIVFLAQPSKTVSCALSGSLAQIQLAPKGRLCLTASVIVRSRRTLWTGGHHPNSVLSGVLAALLLVAITFSVSHSLHRIFHHDGAGSDHFCLACSLAKGQVGAAAVVLISAVLIPCCFWAVLLDHTTPFRGFDYRTSPSRAPPLT